MVPVPAGVLQDGQLDCGLCGGLLVDAVVLSCCGKTFCESCVRKWLRVNVYRAGVPRCPGGCGCKLPFRLPAKCEVICALVERLYPEELAQRREELKEDEEDSEAVALRPFGLRVFQEVAASKDLLGPNRSVVVTYGTCGVVVGTSPSVAEPGRLTVKFDSRLDSSDLCLSVTRCEILPQLPSSFGLRIGQRVVAALELCCEAGPLVDFGVRGVAVRASEDADRLVVKFDVRADGEEGHVNVRPCEIVPCVPLVGGFEVAQPVSAAEDLFAGNLLVVRKGSSGVVLGSRGDTRIEVRFFQPAHPTGHKVNVPPCQIAPHSVS